MVVLKCSLKQYFKELFRWFLAFTLGSCQSLILPLLRSPKGHISKTWMALEHMEFKEMVTERVAGVHWVWLWGPALVSGTVAWGQSSHKHSCSPCKCPLVSSCCPGVIHYWGPPPSEFLPYPPSASWLRWFLLHVDLCEWTELPLGLGWETSKISSLIPHSVKRRSNLESGVFWLP